MREYYNVIKNKEKDILKMLQNYKRNYKII